MKKLFVYNKKAGRKFKSELISLITQHSAFQSNDEIVEIQALSNQEERCTDYDVLVAVGGDGTVNYIASIAYKYKKILSVIPAGSGDGLARHLGISRNINKALNTLQQAQATLIDVCFIDNHFFINLAGCGFEADVAHAFNKMDNRGLWGYLRTVVKLYGATNNQHLVINVDGNELKLDAFSFSLANGSQWGNNFTIAGNAILQDGKVQIAVMKKPKLYQVPGLLFSIFNNKQVDSKVLSYYSGSKIEFISVPDRWHLDGEPLSHKPNTLTIDSKKLKIIA